MADGQRRRTGLSTTALPGYIHAHGQRFPPALSRLPQRTCHRHDQSPRVCTLTMTLARSQADNGAGRPSYDFDGHAPGRHCRRSSLQRPVPALLRAAITASVTGGLVRCGLPSSIPSRCGGTLMVMRRDQSRRVTGPSTGGCARVRHSSEPTSQRPRMLSTTQWGLSTDIRPLVTDFDGDGKTESSWIVPHRMAVRMSVISSLGYDLNLRGFAQSRLSTDIPARVRLRRRRPDRPRQSHRLFGLA